MRDVVAIIGGIGILIGMYLVLRNGKEAVNIVDTIAKNSISGIKTLQGR